MPSSGPARAGLAPARPARRRALRARLLAAAALAAACALPGAGTAAAAAASASPPAPASASASASAAGYQAYVWATGVNVRECRRVNAACPPVGVVGRQYVQAYCQAQGDRVVDGPYTNMWWVEVVAGGRVGWINAVYVSGGANDQPVPGIPGPENCV